jgi:hypothetical protein
MFVKELLREHHGFYRSFFLPLRLCQSVQEERWRDARRQNNQAHYLQKEQRFIAAVPFPRHRNSVDDKTCVKLVMRSLHLLTLDRYFKLLLFFVIHSRQK